MEKWWQDPRLDDEGTYDYLIEELPQDYARWSFTKEKWGCDDCGKDSHLRFETAHYFYCWDGWDSMSWNSCWKCVLKARIFNFRWGVKYNIAKRIKAFKEAKKLYKSTNKQRNFKYWYKFALDFHKR